MTSLTSNRGPRNARKVRVGDSLLWIYTVIALVFLLTPIVYTIVFSFNDSVRSNTVWEGFTLHHWTNLCDQPGICAAVGNSFFIGGVATLAATIIGTMMAIALVRYRFSGQPAVVFANGNPRDRYGCWPGGAVLLVAVKRPRWFCIWLHHDHHRPHHVLHQLCCGNRKSSSANSRPCARRSCSRPVCQPVQGFHEGDFSAAIARHYLGSTAFVCVKF
jgi:hypothetical protein